MSGNGRDDGGDVINLEVLKGKQPEWLAKVKQIAPDMAAAMFTYYAEMMKAGFDRSQALTITIAQFLPKGR